MYLFMCVCMYVCVHVCHGLLMEVRGQFAEVGSFLPAGSQTPVVGHGIRQLYSSSCVSDPQNMFKKSHCCSSWFGIEH